MWIVRCGNGEALGQQGVSYIETVMLWIRAAGAEWLIEKTDKNRSTYYRYYVGGEWDNAHYYDLCLNSRDLGLGKCI